jgi:transposase
MDIEHSAITEPVRRIEVFTGAGRRRSWSDEDKARIVAEIATSGESVCAVARRHGLSPQQLFGWRRRLRGAHAEHSETDGLQFVPAVVDAASSSARAICRQRNASRSEAEPAAGIIEVALDGVVVRVGRGADAKMVIAVLRALKAGT